MQSRTASRLIHASKTVPIKVVVLCLLSLLYATTTPATAADSASAPVVTTADKPLTVSVMHMPPHIIKGANGEWTGIAIDLWKQIATRLYTPDEINKMAPGIDVVLAFSVSKMSEEATDLTVPYMTTGVAIATRQQPNDAWHTIAGKVFSWPFFRVLLLLSLAIIVVGAIVWFIEREHSLKQDGGAMRGVRNGIFWTLEAFFGKGQSLSKTPAARIFSVLWAAVCVVLLSGLTAKLSSELTINQLTQTISGPKDLPKVTVGSGVPSVAATYLTKHGIAFRTYPNSTALMAALADKSIDAAVGTAINMQYLIRTSNMNQLTVLPGTIQNIGLAFGVRKGSPLRKSLNIAILDTIVTEDWQQTLGNYLGTTN
jgi:polar amino acid transport system substrate-binding protein